MKFIIADDHPFTLAGTKLYIEQLGYVVIDIASNGIDAFTKIKNLEPDFAILDINMPGLNGLELVEKLNDHRIKVKTILITSHREMSIYKKAESLGIYGYILKEYADTELKNCIVQILSGEKYKSPKLDDSIQVDKLHIKNESLKKINFVETKIVELIAQQKTSKQIAELLFLSEKTIENHRSKIIEKLNLPQEKNVLLKWALEVFD